MKIFSKPNIKQRKGSLHAKSMFHSTFSPPPPSPPCSTPPAKATGQISINLKLLVDKSSNKVLCAEASREFVDFIFGLLQIPMGCIIRLLRQNEIHISSGNSFGRIYESVAKLENTYFQSNPVKKSLLLPTVVSSASSSIPPMLENFVPLIHNCKTDQFTIVSSSQSHSVSPLILKMNSHSHSAFSSSSVIDTPSLFGTSMMSSSPMSSSAEGTEKVTVGFVKEDNTKYMVLDNLMVTPWSDISLITLINKFSIKDFSSVEERNVKFDFKKSLELVKASFESDTVLTDVFIGKTVR